MHRKHYWFVVLVVLLAGLMVFSAACGEPEEVAEDPEEEVEYKDEFIAAIPGEIQGTDPQQVTTIYGLVDGMLTTPPISLGLNNDQILPYGVEDVEISEDGLQIIFTFDEERTFHNDVPLTPEAYKNSVERYREHSPYAFDFNPVEEMVVEDNTLTLKLSEPGPGMFVVLSSAYGAPVEAGAAEEMGAEEFNRRTIGDGPFTIEEWEDGSHVQLVRNDDYHDHLPFVDNNEAFHFEDMTVRFIPEGFTRVNELRAGNVDMITGVPSEYLDMLREDPDVNVHGYLNSNVRHLQFDHELSLFEDDETRLAVALAIDRAELKTGVDEVIEPVYSIVGPAMLRHSEETEENLTQQYSHDVQRAENLLSDAGWEMGDDGILVRDGEEFEFELAINGDNPIDTVAGPILQDQLYELGIQANVREYAGGYLRDKVEDEDFDLILRNWSWLDPGGVWPAGLHSDGSLAPWSHPEIDEMLDQVVVEPDDERGAQIWGEISEKVWEHNVIIPMWSDRLFVATRDSVTGLHLGVSGALYLHDLKISDDGE